jgi:glucose/arabinose dehydrogenase
MNSKRWVAGTGIVLFALAVAVFDMALTWPRPAAPAHRLAATGALGVGLADFASGLSEPVAIAFTPILTDTRVFVVERAGVIRIVQSNGFVQPTPFLDISGIVDSESYGEMGMLGLAFEPDYATTGRFYVYYTGTGSPGGNTLHLSRFRVSSNANVANTAETPILTIDHPDNQNHDGGQLQFGPEGDLYLAPGDGGSGGDPPNNAQHKDRLLGKVLRLNVTGVPTYTIPVDNPFTQTIGARAEIWALGLRNPFRFSFDKLTGEMYIGDVGQDLHEEVDYQPAGAGGRNYGWHCYEGFHNFHPGDCIGVTGIISPVAEYQHSGPGQVGDAIIGGYVYRGSQYPSLNGYYFFTDNGSGNMWAMRTCSWQVTPLGGLASSPSSFGEDRAGELYLASLGGTIQKLTGPTDLAAPAGTTTGTQVFMPLVERNSACTS